MVPGFTLASSTSSADYAAPAICRCHRPCRQCASRRDASRAAGSCRLTNCKRCAQMAATAGGCSGQHTAADSTPNQLCHTLSKDQNTTPALHVFATPDSPVCSCQAQERQMCCKSISSCERGTRNVKPVGRCHCPPRQAAGRVSQAMSHACPQGMQLSMSVRAAGPMRRRHIDHSGLRLV